MKTGEVVVSSLPAASLISALLELFNSPLSQMESASFTAQKLFSLCLVYGALHQEWVMFCLFVARSAVPIHLEGDRLCFSVKQLYAYKNIYVVKSAFPESNRELYSDFLCCSGCYS